MSETGTESANAEAWRGKVGKLTEVELDAFLAGGHVARLGVLDGEGHYSRDFPQTLPVSFPTVLTRRAKSLPR